MRHKYLRIWNEIANLNVAECELSNWIAKINVAKSLKIWPNANIYVAKSNVHMPKLPRNLSSYIRNFEFIKILSYRHFQTVRILVSFSTTAIYSRLGSVFFLSFSLVKEENEKIKKKNIQLRKQNRKNLCRKIFDKASIRKYLCRKIHFFGAPIRKHLCRILLYPH